jgi:hypothetical protein
MQWGATCCKEDKMNEFGAHMTRSCFPLRLHGTLQESNFRKVAVSPIRPQPLFSY